MDNINNYNFDFDHEVKALRQSLDGLGDNILFIKIKVEEDGTKRLRPWGPNYSAMLAGRHQSIQQAALEEINKYYVRPDSSSKGIKWQAVEPWNPEVEEITGRAVICNEDDSFSGMLGNRNKSLMNLFTLYHETGHTITSSALTADTKRPLTESAADAYAALRFLQRFGEDAVPFLSMVSWLRAYNAVKGYTKHVTTTVLDKIIADSATVDFSKLTPAETIKRAEDYTNEWAPEASVLKEARKAFIHKPQLNDFNLLAETCLASPPNNFAFYIGAKVFQPFLQPEGVFIDGARLRPPALLRRECEALLQARTTGVTLSDIFNKKLPRPRAEPSLAETLKVTLPKGQKQIRMRS